MLAAGHYVLPLFFRSSFSLSSFFRRLISDVAWPIVTTWSMVTQTQIYEIRYIIWRSLLPEIWRPKNKKNRHDFALLRDLIANISGTQLQDIVNRKARRALQTTDNPAQTNLMRYTLVHKRRK